MKNGLVVLLYLSLQIGAIGQSLEQKTVSELREFLHIPNNGLNRDDIAKNIAWLKEAFQKRGFTSLEITTASNPLLLVQKNVSRDLPTVLFYMHLDGQPVDVSKWEQDNPYVPVLKKKNDEGDWLQVPWEQLADYNDPNYRIFARSASDDKMPIVALLNAIDQTEQLAYNVKVILDPEEEMGSPNLAEAVRENLELLQADALIINDGPVHTSGQPTLVYGCRGITSFHLTIYGPSKPQHSGHYGNYAPNPAMRLSQLLGSMKDDGGRVLIPGYYDGIELDDQTKTILESVPDNIDLIHGLLEINEAEKVGDNYQESLQYPSLNVRGLRSAWVGAQARTIVPDIATAAVDIRLVPESNPDTLIKLVKNHIESKGYLILDREPTHEERMKYPRLSTFKATGATLPFRTDMDAPISKWLKTALVRAYKQDPIQIRIMGGTVPISPFINALNVPAIIVPLVNADNNQHSPNENVRIDYITNALKTFQTILTTPLTE